MNKYKIILEYDGTGYRGWQIQKNAKTVQGALITAAEKFLNSPVEIHGAGRTDAGVHALEQVAHLESAKKINCETLRIGLNDLLPSTINILSVENAHPRFHARHSACGRSYLYLIAARRSAFAKRYVWWVRDDLDVLAMKRTLHIFEGFHDFASFADKRMDKHVSTKVAVELIKLYKLENILVIRIVGSHFLWKMVRRIVGVAVEAGRGALTAAEAKAMLGAYSEIPARCTAPPSGLFLEKVLYEGDSLPELRTPVIL